MFAVVHSNCSLWQPYAACFVVSKPAPDWNGTAVVDGDFKEIKLSDFKGKYLVFFFYPLDL
jgi:alkyl hydroperoxide reductase subunit AhpC